MTSQKPKEFKKFTAFILGISIVSIIVVTLVSDSCGVKHIGILNDISEYEKDLDPEFCESIIDKIDSFNDQCTPQIEILDCG